MLVASNYVEAFRLDHSAVRGRRNLTYVMALPWQADFNSLRRQLVARAARQLRDPAGHLDREQAWKRGV